MQAGETGRVTRRRVFYIPGYDPFHPRRYRELYRKESAAQAAISGYEIELRAKPAGEAYGWHVLSRQDGAEVETDVEVLVWSDIVRDSMGQSIPATYLQLFRTARTYIGTGALTRLMRLRKGPVIAALYPIGLLLAQLALAIGAAALAYAALTTLVPHPLARLASLLSALALIPLILHWFRKQDGRLFAYYLMHDYAFSARCGGANPPALETRMARFRQTIADALREDWDEVLIVGHSSGAHLAISILADLLREHSSSSWPKYSGGPGAAPPSLSLLTLGQVVPMMSFLPKAQRLRADLRFLSICDTLTWVDVSAPGDGCAFALCDPVAVSGVAPKGQRWPLVISAAFSQTLSPERWAALRWRFFRLHFQYLCAFDRPGDYDYFRITSGPLTLAARFEGRAPSKSRIVRPLNRFTETA